MLIELSFNDRGNLIYEGLRHSAPRDRLQHGDEIDSAASRRHGSCFRDKLTDFELEIVQLAFRRVAQDCICFAQLLEGFRVPRFLIVGMEDFRLMPVLLPDLPEGRIPGNRKNGVEVFHMLTIPR